MDHIDQQAECFFIANFVKIAEAGPGKGYLDFVIPLLNAPKPSRCLPLAFSAVSQAAFATYQHSPISLSKTRLRYLQALSQINMALRDPTQALDDSVVASVLLLAKFEASVKSSGISSLCHSDLLLANNTIRDGLKRLEISHRRSTDAFESKTSRTEPKSLRT